MSLTTEQLEFLLERGLTLADAIEFARLGAPEKAVSKGAERTRRWRENKARDATVTSPETPHGDVSHVGERPQVVTPFSSSLRSEEVGVGGVERERAVSIPGEDWPEGGAQAHAKRLVETIASPWLDPMKSPDLVTTAGRLAAWKRDGASWEHDVVPVVTGLSANRRSRIASWKFFDEAIARSIADNRAALEIPEARANRPTGPPGLSFAAQLSAENAEARRRVLES